MTLRLGITSPIVTRVPGVAGDWEADAGVEDLVAIAEAADRLGFDHLTCSEHVAVPVDVAAQRGATYWDPLATLGFLAARTRSIRLVTQVLVLGYHHPLEIAKRYGTLDRVSGGRLVLGVGVGSLAEEFALLGAQFAGRGEIADDALRAVRAAWGRERPSYAGPHFEFSGMVVDPHGLRTEVPVWVGGRTPRSLRRAVDLGDGWVPFGLDLDTLSEMLSRAERPAEFDVVLGTGRPVDPLGDPSRTRDRLRRIGEAGATVAGVTIAATSAEHYVEQLETLAALDLQG